MRRSRYESAIRRLSAESYRAVDENPIRDEKYKVTFADGTTRDGMPGREGVARMDATPSGPYRVEFFDDPAFSRQDQQQDQTQQDQQKQPEEDR